MFFGCVNLLCILENNCLKIMLWQVRPSSRRHASLEASGDRFARGVKHQSSPGSVDISMHPKARRRPNTYRELFRCPDCSWRGGWREWKPSPIANVEPDKWLSALYGTNVAAALCLRADDWRRHRVFERESVTVMIADRTAAFSSTTPASLPFRNMVYIPDGPSDIPVFSVCEKARRPDAGGPHWQKL
jgi:hypothetical protein